MGDSEEWSRPKTSHVPSIRRYCLSDSILLFLVNLFYTMKSSIFLNEKNLNPFNQNATVILNPFLSKCLFSVPSSRIIHWRFYDLLLLYGATFAEASKCLDGAIQQPCLLCTDGGKDHVTLTESLAVNFFEAEMCNCTVALQMVGIWKHILLSMSMKDKLSANVFTLHQKTARDHNNIQHIFFLSLNVLTHK